MRSLTPLWRSLRVTEHLFTGAAIAFGVALGRRLGFQVAWVPDVTRWWHARLCRCLGVRVNLSGELSPNALLVANHVSWLDIPVIGAQGGIGFLSKSEVGNWPLIGWMAGIAGTLFIERGAGQARHLAGQIAERVRSCGPLVIFPEGTTTDGTRLERFHSRLFAAGQQAGVTVQPLALRFGTNLSPDRVAPFVGEDALLPHLARLIRHPGLRVHVHFLPPLDGCALSRKHICEHCRSAIAEALGLGRSAPAASWEGAGTSQALVAAPDALGKAA
jgi:1-acyl-sn-glycerol-3-phosphate acyltransferase